MLSGFEPLSSLGAPGFLTFVTKMSNSFGGSPVPEKHLVDVLSLSKSPAAYVTLISITTDMTH